MSSFGPVEMPHLLQTLTKQISNNTNFLKSLRNPFSESMSESEKQDESALSTKRKLSEQEENQYPSLKTPKLHQNGAAEPQNDYNDCVSDDDNDDDDDYKLDEEEEKPKAVVDKKGKGILIEKQANSDSDDNEEDVSDDEDDDSDDSDEEGGSSSSVSEEEDPLAEVDLDNILSSRTRRKISKPGVCIKDVGLNGNDG